MLKNPYLSTQGKISKSCKIRTNESSHLKIGDVLDIDICFIHAENKKKLSDSFLVIYQKTLKMAIFGIKMAKTKTNDSINTKIGVSGDIDLYIVSVK